MKWTEEQEKAIFEKNNNILVAAAAGSGKTAVLVERIIQKILNDKIDIDKLLIVTFTNAAASEMRERVLDAIYKKLDDNPDDENLQKQIVLLGKSNICTIHSFCLDVIKNNFFEVDLPANFRIASEEEIALLQQEALEEVFEELYENENESFAKLIESYTGYRGDEPVKDIVFNIYRMIQSMPFPQKWLEKKVAMFDRNSHSNQDFSHTIWGRILLDNFKEELLDSINNIKVIKNKLDKYEEMEKYSLTLKNDIEMLEQFYDKCETWDGAFEFANNMKFKTWPSDKKANSELKEEAKKVRDNIKKKINGIIEKTLIYNSENAYNDIFLMHDNLVAFKDLVLKFDTVFSQKKKNKNMIDFSDIEHYALKILLKIDENGNYIPTDVARKYQEKFQEIAIDEYQDSNRVQELILGAVSRKNNIFMVGDVKQSIYKFRQACPELFLEKYEKYTFNGNKEGMKIQLFKNFRSNSNVLDITNKIFKSIMSKELGDIDYTEDEFLNLGADYPQIKNSVGKSELHLIDTNEKEEKNLNWDDTEDDVEGIEENFKQLDKIEIEAKFVAEKIKELVESEKLIKCKNGEYKRIEYRDIVILLRSTSKLAPIFERELVKNNIPVFSDSITEYLNTIEVQTIINLLKILDNPLNDILLVSVMRSPIGEFKDNEILEIRLSNREESMYANLLHTRNNSNKVSTFLDDLEKWKDMSETSSLAELIWQIYIDTGFLNYVGLMPNGALRQANLKMVFERAKEYEKTSFKGLFNFIRFIERLSISSGDMSAAKVIGESENVVRIMSIHKSKGLEFPVVFLCCTQKKINLQDLRTNVLLHNEIGFGPEYIDYDRKIQYPTAAKQAIKIVSKNEAISEEMRVLYVALTRAKEKIIITGTVNNIEKLENDKKEILNIYNGKDGKINPILIKKNISYLDWIYLVYLNENIKDDIELYKHTKDELQIAEKAKEDTRDFDFSKNIDFDTIEKKFNWNYKDAELTNLPMKTTVSEMKQLENSKENDNKVGLEEIKAKFMEDTNQMTSARKGTLIHLVFQKINFNKKYNDEELKNFISSLVMKNLISEKETKYIDLKKIKLFLNSQMYDRIQEAKVIEKEKTFCIKLALEEYNNQEILIQGIIDLYFIDKDDKLVLLDYKTDLVDNENILKNRYRIQLEIYQKALEISMNRKVDEVYIYSTNLNKFINF